MMLRFWDKPVEPPPTESTSWLLLSVCSFTRIFLSVWIKDNYIISILRMTSFSHPVIICLAQACLMSAIAWIPDTVITIFSGVLLETFLGFVSVGPLLAIYLLLPDFLKISLGAVLNLCITVRRLVNALAFTTKMKLGPIRHFVENMFCSQSGSAPSTDFHQWLQTFMTSREESQRDDRETLAQSNRTPRNGRLRDYSAMMPGGLCKKTRSGSVYGRYPPPSRMTRSGRNDSPNSSSRDVSNQDRQTSLFLSSYGDGTRSPSNDGLEQSSLTPPTACDQRPMLRNTRSGGIFGIYSTRPCRTARRNGIRRGRRQRRTSQI